MDGKAYECSYVPLRHVGGVLAVYRSTKKKVVKMGSNLSQSTYGSRITVRPISFCGHF